MALGSQISEIFQQQEQPQGESLSALLIMLLERLLRPLPNTDPREQNAREIPVRPRIEPLGGS